VTVRIEKRGRRIEIRSEEPVPGLRTTIPGAYQTVSGFWTVPLSLESCKLLREKFGGRLKIGDELVRWAKGVVDSRKYMAELVASKDADLENLPTAAPRLAKAMNRRKYQRVGARFVADNTATLVADDPGLGKTLIAMGGILEAGIPGPYLVVAPKTAADTVWRREITRWLPRQHRPIILPESRDQRERKIRLGRYGEFTWLIVHPEIVMVQSWWVCGQCGERTAEGPKQQRDLTCGHVRDRKTKTEYQESYPKLFEIEWGAVVVDESHESLIKRTGVKTQRRRGLDMLRLRNDGIKIAMSGTPFDSKAHQLWGTLNWLDPKTYSAFQRWMELYWQKGGYTGYGVGEFRKDREPMLWDSLTSIALRRTKAEVATDLPPKVYVGSELIPGDPQSPIGIWLEMEGKQAAAYRAMEKTTVAELDSGRLEATGNLEELTRLKQLASAYGEIYTKKIKGEIHYRYRPLLPSNKFNWTVENLEEWGYPKTPLTKVVIVSFYTGILEVFAEGIERHFRTKPGRPLCTAITGRTPMNQRRAIIDRFNQRDSASPNIMLLNVKAGGTAITLDTADRMIFISETRIPDQQKQAEDRIHRVSNPRHCMYYYLRSLETVDVGTALVNQEMERESHRLLDERRGVAYMRHVMALSKVAIPGGNRSA
jgi:SNF2 family DNA or RNA helicase